MSELFIENSKLHLSYNLIQKDKVISHLHYNVENGVFDMMFLLMIIFLRKYVICLI